MIYTASSPAALTKVDRHCAATFLTCTCASIELVPYSVGSFAQNLHNLIRYLSLLLLLFSSLPGARAQVERLRLPFSEDGRYGMIDSTGRVIIPPKYAALGNPNEGLIPAREHGYYGYIDLNGQEVLPACYDYAEAFTSGRAKIYRGGVPALIDRSGRVVYQSLGFEFDRIAGQNLVLATIDFEKQAVVDFENQFVLDSIYTDITIDPNGIAHVTYRQPVADPEAFAPRRMRLYDLNGHRWLTGLNEFSYIGAFSEGVALAKRVAAPYQTLLRIDGTVARELTDGRIRPHGYQQPWFGLFAATLFKRDPRGMNSEEYAAIPTSYALIDSLGRTVCTGDRWVNDDLPILPSGIVVVPFTDNYHLFDTKCNQITERGYEEIYYRDAITTGVIARRADTFYLLGPDGLPRGTPYVKPAEVQYELYPSWTGHQVLLSTEIDLAGTNDWVFHEAWWHPLSGAQSDFAKVTIRPLDRGYMQVIDGREYQLLTPTGQVIYMGRYPDPALVQRDVDYMRSGEFYARGARLDGPRRRWNDPVEDDFRPNTELPFPATGVQLVLDTTNRDPGNGAYPVYLINATQDTLAINVSDGRLHLTAEARVVGTDAWRSIEHLQSSWCGNSYYAIGLPGGSHWRWSLPHYRGALRAEVRLRLAGWEDKDLVSNAVIMGANPGQFFRVLRYEAVGLMDPYGG